MKKIFLIILTLFCAFIAIAAATSSKTIMVFGDSLSANYGMSTEAGWVTLLAQRLQSKFNNYQIINASISGETTLGGRNRIEKALDTHRPEIVILELGANDGLRGAPIRSIYENLEVIIKVCQQYNTSILLVGMRLPPNYGASYTKKFEAIFPQLTEAYQIRLVPFLLADFADKPEFFQTDGIHPNEIAQGRILESVWEVLKSMLTK